MAKQKKWTPEEVRKLRRIVDGTKTMKEIAAFFPERTIDSVRGRVKMMRLDSKVVHEKERQKAIMAKRRSGNKKDERGIYAKRALELFKRKFEVGTPFENYKRYGHDALKYWLECLEESHKYGLYGEVADD